MEGHQKDYPTGTQVTGPIARSRISSLLREKKLEQRKAVEWTAFQVSKCEGSCSVRSITSVPTWNSAVLRHIEGADA